MPSHNDGHRSSALHRVSAGRRHLLLDFDGPVCTLFAGTPAPVVAEQFRAALRDAGITVPDDVQDDGDPLEVFRAVAFTDTDVAIKAQQELSRLEQHAASSARPTPGAAELISTAHDTKRDVAIITNNSSAAVHAYLDAHHLSQYVVLVVGRNTDPELMKPSPYQVRAAVGILDSVGAECVFVGDSPSDVLAGRLAGVAVIGFANKPGKAATLTQAGADAVTTRLAEISAALRAAPVTALPN